MNSRSVWVFLHRLASQVGIPAKPSNPQIAGSDNSDSTPGPTARKSQQILSRGKRCVYFVGILVALIPLALPFTPLAGSEYRYSAASIISHIPAATVAAVMMWCLIRGKYLHLVETVLWVSCAAFMLWWDVMGLVQPIDTNYVGAGRNILLIMACFFLALSMPGKRSWGVIGLLYTTHMSLLWARLLSEPWGASQAYHLVDSTLSTLVVLLVISIPLYHAAVNASNSAEDAMRVEASTDHLTELPNRRWLMQRMATKPPAFIALLDLDNFKDINDAHGHATGDRVLKNTASALASALADCGTVGRWGGEEFLVLLDTETLDEAAHALARAQECVDQESQNLIVTFSAGIAAVGPDGDLDAALSQADKLMYHIKRFGKNGVATTEGSYYRDQGSTPLTSDRMVSSPSCLNVRPAVPNQSSPQDGSPAEHGESR